MENMQEILAALDIDVNKKISYKEFCAIIEKPEALRALDEVGVNPVGVVDFAELFFFEDGHPIELEYDVFMEKILDLREANDATVKDVLNIWNQVKTTTNR